MLPDDDNEPGPVSPKTRVDPPKVYFAACGALCDIFWWARRGPDAAQPPPVKNETP